MQSMNLNPDMIFLSMSHNIISQKLLVILKTQMKKILGHAYAFLNRNFSKIYTISSTLIEGFGLISTYTKKMFVIRTRNKDFNIHDIQIPLSRGQKDFSKESMFEQQTNQ